MRIPTIVKVRNYSKELEISCKELGLDPEYIASLGPSIVVLSLPFILLLSFLNPLLILLEIPIALISVVIPEIPKVLYKRRLLKDMEEIPYALSIFTTSYIITKNFERSSKEVVESFGGNRIIRELREICKYRFISGKEEVDFPRKFEDIREFFKYVNSSLKLSSKRIVEEGFKEFLRRFRERKIRSLGRAYLKILLIYTFGTLLPIVILSSFPVLSFFLKGTSKYLIPVLILITSFLINFVITSSLKYELRGIKESVGGKFRIPSWFFPLIICLSSPSILNLFLFLGFDIKVRFLKLIGLNLIPLSFSIAYFLTVFGSERRYLKVEEEIEGEIKKLPRLARSLMNSLEMGLSVEVSIKRILEEEGISKPKSSLLKWFLRKVEEMREKSREKLISFSKTFCEIMESLNEYREELIRRTQNISAMMKYTAIFILPLVSSIIIKASVMIAESYKEVREFYPYFEEAPFIGIEISEKDVMLIDLLMYSYVLLSGYVMLDFAHHLNYGEGPRKRLLVSRDLLISSLVYFIGSVFVRVI